MKMGKLRARLLVGEAGGGQGTTEYAIGLAVVAAVAVVCGLAFKGNLKNLWNTAATSMTTANLGS